MAHPGLIRPLACRGQFPIGATRLQIRGWITELILAHMPRPPYLYRQHETIRNQIEPRLAPKGRVLWGPVAACLFAISSHGECRVEFNGTQSELEPECLRALGE